jgi:lipopolysaccharide/colanic/teichoic acid biosynthesis glycosyltransferase
MSLVGRRPEDPRHVSHYTTEQSQVFRVPPALTGPAVLVDEEKTLFGNSHEEVESRYISEFVPKKVQINLNYLENWTLRVDIVILVQTAFALIPLFRLRALSLAEKGALETNEEW